MAQPPLTTLNLSNLGPVVDPLGDQLAEIRAQTAALQSPTPVATGPTRQDLTTQGRALGQSIAGAIRPAIAAGDRSAIAPLYSTFQPQVSALRSQWQTTTPTVAPYVPFDEAALRSNLEMSGVSQPVIDQHVQMQKSAYDISNPPPAPKTPSPARESYNRIIGLL